MELRVVVIAVALAVVPPAAMASEGESALSVSLGYGTYMLHEYRPDGAVLGVEYERGISDGLAWRVSGGGGAYHGSGGLSYSAHMVGGITYLFDVLKYVPYAQLGVGAIGIAGGGQERELSLLLEIGGGLDVLHSRTFSYGVQVKLESFVEQTAFFTAGLRMTWRWGFF